jgi:hypothetical protein
VRLLRVAPASQTALDLGPGIASVPPAAVAIERGWWRLPEQARVEVIGLLARLIARGVLVEDPPTGAPLTPATGGTAGPGAGEQDA